MVMYLQLGLSGGRRVDVYVTSGGTSQHRTLCQAGEWVQTQTGLRQKRYSPAFFFLISFIARCDLTNTSSRRTLHQTLGFSCMLRSYCGWEIRGWITDGCQEVVFCPQEDRPHLPRLEA